MATDRFLLSAICKGVLTGPRTMLSVWRRCPAGDLGTCRQEGPDQEGRRPRGAAGGAGSRPARPRGALRGALLPHGDAALSCISPAQATPSRCRPWAAGAVHPANHPWAVLNLLQRQGTSSPSCSSPFPTHLHFFPCSVLRSPAAVCCPFPPLCLSGAICKESRACLRNSLNAMAARLMCLRLRCAHDCLHMLPS